MEQTKMFSFEKNESCSIYEGNVKDGLYHGFGSLYRENGELFYKGYFKYGKFHGYGKFFSNLGKIQYRGYWKKGHRNGMGIQYHSNGEVMYKGKWKFNLWEGFGFFFTFEGKKIYEGFFHSSLRHGYGIHFNHEKIRYIGNWKNDFPYGQGISFYSNGKIEYQGGWKQGYRHGQGILFCKETSRPKQNGLWKNDFFSSDFIFRKKKRYEMLLESFLETRNSSCLDIVPTESIHVFLKKKKISFSKHVSREKLIKKLISFPKNREKNEKDEYDLFGNRYIHPVKGSDGEIYDKSSMEYLFLKDSDGKYINIPYHYSFSGELEPYFPIMANGKKLFSFL